MLLSLILGLFSIGVIYCVDPAELIDRNYIWIYIETEDELSRLKTIFAQNANDRSVIVLGTPRLEGIIDVFCDKSVRYMFDGFNLKDYTPSLENHLKWYYQNFGGGNKREEGFDFDKFHSYDDIMTQLDEWSNNCPDGLKCEVKDIGQTFEGRSIRSLSLSSDQGYKPRGTMWLSSGLVANEWLGPAALMNAMNRLLARQPAETPIIAQVDDILKRSDIYMVPIVNPDGYAHSMENDRFWRKNRRALDGVAGPGVFLDRNFNINWDYKNQSILEIMADNFKGDEPASEAETQAIQNEILRLMKSATPISLLLDVVSFGRAVLTPYSWRHPDTSKCPHFSGFDKIVSSAMQFAKRAGTLRPLEPFTVKQACEDEPSAGSFLDYVYEFGNVRTPLRLQLRSRPSNGLLLETEDMISISSREILAGLSEEKNEKNEAYDQFYPSCARTCFDSFKLGMNAAALGLIYMAW